jgi:drug/metabolite transporter (DMT)-like permease
VTTRRAPLSGSPYLPLALAVVCVSLGSILVRLAAAPALAVAFHRVFLATALLAPFTFASARRTWPALSRTQALCLAGAGLALGAHFATWIASLSRTSVASSVLLVNTAPLFTLGFSRAFLGERVPATVLAATGLALAGAAMIAAGDWAAGADSLAGDLLALAGAVTLSIYHVAGRGLRDALPLGAYVLAVWGGASLTLLALLLPAGLPVLVGYPPRTLLAFFALALIPTLAGHGLVNRSLRHLSAPTVGLFMLGEPIGATLLAFLLLGERPGAWTLAGGAVVLAALALVITRGER